MSDPTPTRTNIKDKVHHDKLEQVTLKRRGVTEQIRKSSRLDHVGKRRYGVERKEVEEEEEVSPESLTALATLLQQYTSAHTTNADPSTFLPLLTSIHPYLIHDPCIHLVITSGVMNIWMIHVNNPILQHMILSCLADMASSTSPRLTSHLHIFLPFLTSHLTSSITSQQHQGIIDVCNTIGNLVAEDLSLRITLLSQDILTLLLKIFLPTQMDVGVLRVVTWMISNLVKLHPSYHDDMRDACQTQLSRILATPLVSRILALLTYPHVDVQSECMWILATLSSLSSQIPSQLLSSHFIPLTSSHWSQPDSIRIPLIRIIGIFASGASEWNDAIIQRDVLNGLYDILIHTEHRGLRKEVVWTIANIAAGKKEHVDALLASNFLPPLIQFFLTSPYDIRCECAHALYHIARISPDYLMIIMNHDSIRTQCTEHSHPIIGMYLSLLTAHVDTIIASLSMIELILQSYPNGRTLVEEMDGITAMEQLQVSEHRHLYARVCDMIDKYFGEEEEVLEEEPQREEEYPVWRSQGNGPVPPQRPQPPSREPAPPSQFTFSSSPSPSTPFEF